MFCFLAYQLQTPDCREVSSTDKQQSQLYFASKSRRIWQCDHPSYTNRPKNNHFYFSKPLQATVQCGHPHLQPTKFDRHCQSNFLPPPFFPPLGCYMQSSDKVGKSFALPLKVMLARFNRSWGRRRYFLLLPEIPMN